MNIENIICEEIKEKDRERRISAYSLGIIEYFVFENNAVISKIEYKKGELLQAKTAIVIPEKLDKYEAVGILPNSLNNLRKDKCRMVIIPNSVKIVGSENCKLYSEFEEKGTYVKPKLFWANRRYNDYLEFLAFYNKLSESNCEKFYEFEIELDELILQDFIQLKNHQDKNDFWKYPEDGKWIAKDELIKYTGSEKKVVIDECIRIAENAFVNIVSEEIVFGPKVQRFSSNMIHHCECLKKLTFWL